MGALVTRLVTVLFSVYLILWVNKFIGTEKIPDQVAATGVYTLIVGISMIGGLIAIPLIGILADKVSNKILLPIVFLIRGLCLGAFYFLKDAAGIASIALMTVIIIMSFAEATVLETVFWRKLPGDVRGTMNGCFSAFGMVGTLIYLQAAGRAFDKLGEASPFVIVFFCDIFMVLLCLILLLTKKFKD